MSVPSAFRCPLPSDNGPPLVDGDANSGPSVSAALQGGIWGYVLLAGLCHVLETPPWPANNTVLIGDCSSTANANREWGAGKHTQHQH